MVLLKGSFFVWCRVVWVVIFFIVCFFGNWLVFERKNNGWKVIVVIGFENGCSLGKCCLFGCGFWLLVYCSCFGGFGLYRLFLGNLDFFFVFKGDWV